MFQEHGIFFKKQNGELSISNKRNDLMNIVNNKQPVQNLNRNTNNNQ